MGVVVVVGGFGGECVQSGEVCRARERGGPRKCAREKKKTVSRDGRARRLSVHYVDQTYTTHRKNSPTSL